MRHNNDLSTFFSVKMAKHEKYMVTFDGLSKNVKSKSFLLRKYKHFFNIRARKFHFLKYKGFFWEGGFFIFFELGIKSALGSSITYYFIMNPIMVKSPMDGIGGTTKNVVFRQMKLGQIISNSTENFARLRTSFGLQLHVFSKIRCDT